jgi:hypothetical protein
METIQQEREKALKLLKAVERGLRHKNYDRTILVDELCFMLSTGEGLTNKLHQFKTTESDEDYKIRKEFTQSIIPVVYNSLSDPQYKVPRSNNAVRVLTYDREKKDTLKKLEKILLGFEGKTSVDDWMASRWIEMNNDSPNSFVILEWEDTDVTEDNYKPFPYEVKSKDVLYYEEQHKVLSCVVVNAPREIRETINDKENVKHSARYTFYGMNLCLSINHKEDNEILPEGVETLMLNGDVWWVDEPLPHNLNFVPAFRPGYTKDKLTDGETYVSPVNRAVPILLKLLEADSQYDITQAFHIFPRQIRYDIACNEKGCMGGLLPDGRKCPACHGTGFKGRTNVKSPDHSITLALPKDPTPDAIVDLSKLIYYVSPPVELLAFMEQHVTKLKEDCREALYGSEMFTRKQVMETATKQVIDLQNVYDSLYPMSIAWAGDWEFVIMSIAKITQLDGGLIVSYRFGKDFKMKTLDDLYSDLRSISDSGADAFIKSSVQDDIAGIIYAEDPQQMAKYWAMKTFYPFPGKSKEEILSIISQGLTSKFNSVLWANYDSVFSELEQEQAGNAVNFWELDRTKQFELLQVKVNSIMKTLEVPAPIFGA